MTYLPRLDEVTPGWAGSTRFRAKATPPARARFGARGRRSPERWLAGGPNRMSGHDHLIRVVLRLDRSQAAIGVGRKHLIRVSGHLAEVVVVEVGAPGSEGVEHDPHVRA